MIYSFNNSSINPDKFDRELRTAFEEKYDYLNTEGSSISIFFSSDLSGAEITALETLISNHNPVDVYAERIRMFSRNQGNALSILNEIYAANSDEKNNQMISDYAYLISVIREGHFAKAISLLAESSPSGLITQDDLDLWSTKIFNA